MISVESLLKMRAAARPLRAYAYLTTALRGQPGDADALDCLTPFLRAGVEQQEHGAEVDYGALSAFLESLGLRIPTFVLQHLTPRLEPLVEKRAGDWFVKKIAEATEADVALDVLDDAFDALESELAAFARTSFKAVAPPVSETWTDAIIAFLKSATSLESSDPKTSRKPTPVIEGRNTLVRDPNFERLIVAEFIRECDDDPAKESTIEHIVQVFTGILIEDFLGTIQTMNRRTKYYGLHIYYDTTIILRLLGTSGKILQLSAIEMHNSLQRLGCQIHYLDITASEITNILTGIVNDPQDAHPETVEAYDSGELVINDIRDYPETYETRLKEDFGVTLVRYNKRSVKSLEINESALTQLIVATRRTPSQDVKRQEARARKDARAVAMILQLREGTITSDVGFCKHLFVSNNPIFQRVAKQFVENSVPDYQENEGSIPPIVTLGQLATLSWLMAPEKMEPVKITRELLAVCYNAVRPDPAWTRKFTETFNAYAKKNLSVVEQIAESAIFRKTARSLMQSETFGQASLIDPSSISEIIRRAQEQAEQKDKIKIERILARKQREEQARLDELARARELAAQREEELRRLAEQNKILQELHQSALNQARIAEEDARRAKERAANRIFRQNIVSLIFVILIPVVAIVILRNNYATILTLIVYLVVAAPLIWAVTNNSSEMSEHNIVDLYRIGVSAISKILKLPMAVRSPEPGTQADGDFAEDEGGGARTRTTAGVLPANPVKSKTKRGPKNKKGPSF